MNPIVSFFRRHVLAAVGLALSFALIAPGVPGSLHAAEVCFEPDALDEEVCVDFSRHWYAIELSAGFAVLHLREVNSPAASHIWDAGSYLLTEAQANSLAEKLKGAGLPPTCLHPPMRREADRAKPRDQYCQ